MEATGSSEAFENIYQTKLRIVSVIAVTSSNRMQYFQSENVTTTEQTTWLT
jgi:hypothetical protein